MLLERLTTYSKVVFVALCWMGADLGLTRRVGCACEQVDTVVWVKRMAEEGSLDLVVDPRLLPAGGVATDDAEYVLGLALRCVETNALKRPKMSQVVKMLESEDVIVVCPHLTPTCCSPPLLPSGCAMSVHAPYTGIGRGFFPVSWLSQGTGPGCHHLQPAVHFFT